MNSHNPFAPSAEQTAERKRVADAIAAGPRGAVGLPFKVLLNSPPLAERISSVGEYIRYYSSLPADIREIAVLVTARARECGYEAQAHRPHALKAGVAPRLVEEIANGQPPQSASPAQGCVIAFCTELNRDARVSKTTRSAALDMLGVEWVTELVGICGYYTMLAMAINVGSDQD